MRKELTNTFLSMFCMEMHMLLQAGIALDEGVLMLQDDEPEKEGKAVLQCLLDELDKGESLSSALRKAAFFPRYMVSMIETGEKTGRLAETLRALSEYYDREERQSIAVKNAVLYPAILLVMMVAVVLILIIYVLPVFNDVFGRLGSRMSPLATNLMQFGGWLGNVSAIIAAVGGAIFIAVMAMWIMPGLRESVVKAFKNRFGSRGIFGSTANAHFVAAMTLSVASGLDAEEAMKMAASVSGGTKAVDEKNALCVDMLRSGKTLHEAMRDAGILSARDGRMLALGVRSGMADMAMTEIARRKERDVQDDMDRLIGRIEPALVITTSIIVGVILLSVMLPLMGIMASIE
ncbi:MAG: type II secretion system F family protein [Synergistaceae bacterium]|nr:type II secretion system F family protein [Synergistaceae bacterium]